ncbi:hypothetical protein LCGC14_2298080 [marine sediment metagenome]|uniref:Uncharacterized protein n=1 Tax=marine sediment metagenome TaxID=412755 RepID=A0A0F9CP77_9ZZZZ
MEKTSKTEWGFICEMCGHEADNHTSDHCEKAVRTEYDSTSFMLGPSKVTARIICDCTSLTLLRVKTKKETRWE